MGAWIGKESGARFWRHLPEVALVIVTIFGLGRAGLFVSTPPWVLALLLVAGAAVISMAFSRWGADAGRGELHRRVAVQTGVLGAIIYATGWGPVLSMVHLFAVADNVKYSGSRAVRPVVAWAAGVTLLGQVAIATGVAPSGLDTRVSHMIAVFAALVIAFVASRIGRMTREKESVEGELAVNEARFRSLVQEASDVTMVISDARLTYVSPSVSRVLGYTEEELADIRYVDLIHDDDKQGVADAVVAMMGEQGGSGLIECRLRHRDGHWVPFESSCRNLLDDPVVAGFVITGRDVSERKELEQALEHRAFHDALTGLANRALFRDRIEHVVARSARSDMTFGVLYVDLDGFKVINDTLGHAVGDGVLAEVAERLRAAIREVDTAARLGGDEFAILLEDMNEESGAARVAQRILDSLRQPIRVGVTEVTIDASIGIAIHDRGETAEELLRNGDIAMYMAKNAGKGCYEIFEPAMHLAVVERLKLESDLQKALDRDELALHYQPIVNLKDRSIVGVEALLRWIHPERGMVSPGEFIPLAEETGLIIPIGRWVLLEACQQIATWQQLFSTEPPLHVSVNVSMKQLSHGDVVADVREALALSGIDPSGLTLELTESALVQDPDATVKVLRELKGLGVRLAVDDFGTGYSSLSYLQRFPVDVLKIDRSFVEGVVDGSQNPALVRAIVDIGHSLKLETVAEGIEHDEELTQCRALQCHLGQGYLFARPAKGDDIEELLVQQVGYRAAGQRLDDRLPTTEV
ncbi:MAG: putative bifunctional diguanylate cyclase/phosphodiesterase [Actinomycetes bacterium]